jgi:carbon-monoxide dehydrogenase large subunit
MMQFGKDSLRLEDGRFVTGRGCYVDDINLPGQCYAALVVAPHAHAKILGIDKSEALRVSGVICVLDGSDLKKAGLGGLVPYTLPRAWGGPDAYSTRWSPLVVDRVRFVGDRVAIVVAEDAHTARAAADLVAVDYEVLPSVVRLNEAVLPDAPLVWDDCVGNVSFATALGDQAATAQALASAAYVAELDLVNNRLAPSPIEPRAAIGRYDTGLDFYTLYTSSQNPHGVRAMLAVEIFRISENRIRVISPDVGGGFGVKANPYPEDALVLWAARLCGRPVKWTGTRSEALMCDSHGRDQSSRAQMAFDDSGRILALRVDALHALGAYFFSASASPVRTMMRMLPNVYDIKTIYFTSRAVFTNTAPIGVYRGAGRPEAVYITERLLDQAARTLDLDPVEIRRRNLIAQSAMPYKTATGCVYDSGDFEGALDGCLKLVDWNGFPARREKSLETGHLRGRGVALYVEYGGVLNDNMHLRFDPSGDVTILAGTHSHGQGHETTYTQMLSHFLGIRPDRIRFVQGDTDKVAFGRGTYAARSSLVGGCALKLAADAIVTKGKGIAARLMNVSHTDVEFQSGIFRNRNSNQTVTLDEVVKACFHPMELPEGFSIGLEATGSYAATPPNYPNGAHICEVVVDPTTGASQIDRYAAVDDVGRVINTMICEGQMHGGVAQGIGQALLESIVYDPSSGQLVTGSFMDYAMPRANDLPSFAVSFKEIPCTTNPLGIKGVGEAGAVPSTAAVMNALLDALAPVGIVELGMPATAASIWNAINAARSNLRTNLQ